MLEVTMAASHSPSNSETLAFSTTRTLVFSKQPLGNPRMIGRMEFDDE